MRRQQVFMSIMGIIMAVLLGACIQPGVGPQGQGLNWDSVIEDGNLADSVYSIGLLVDVLGYLPVGTGFAAHYPNTLWTNAHVVLALRNILLKADPASSVVPVAVRAGTRIGGDHTYQLNMGPGGYTIHPEYAVEEVDWTPDLAVFHVPDTSFRNVPSFLPRALIGRRMPGTLRGQGRGRWRGRRLTVRMVRRAARFDAG